MERSVRRRPASGAAEDYAASVMERPVNTDDAVSPPSGEPRPPRRRDRHGRGMRGPVAPPQVPLSASRAEAFSDLVQDSVERLERRWPQLAEVDFLILDVPRLTAEDEAMTGGTVPLGGTVPARDDTPARVVIYRRPVEIRTKGREEQAALVHEVVVEQVAEVLGLTPETVDPRYGDYGDGED